MVLGVVQGVGFRPFVAETARELSIRGSVCNSGGVVRIEAFGTGEAMEEMIRRLRFCAPTSARVERVVVEEGKEAGYPEPADFRIVESEKENKADIPLIPPDLPICEDCLAEMRDPSNRRFRYPFISCTACGPRYSILEALPYDREHISMRDYAMCAECRREYRQPGGRRRHAQTISCPDCGPQLILSGPEEFASEVTSEGNVPSGLQPDTEAALEKAAGILKAGGLLAVKGIGGYQFACRPDLEETVRRLRLLKGREKKPFAVMFPSLESIRAFCRVSRQEEALLVSPARPIVLLERKGVDAFCPSLCSESRYLGAFLPYTGLHQLLTEEVGPLVMTSANVTDDPIFTQEKELAQLWQRFPDFLSGAAWNTRRIVTPLDDSLMRVTAGHVQMLRRSRGFVPSPVYLAERRHPASQERTDSASQRNTDPAFPVLAFGGDLKAVFCLAAGNRAYLSQYFGDMENFRVYQIWKKELSRMEKLFGLRPGALVCDLHPGYVTAQMAEKTAKESGLFLLRVQHHHAHAASVMAEHGLERCIGVVFDGTGYGTDGHVWGGEFLLCEGAFCERVGHLEEIGLAGGDAAALDAALDAACHLADLSGPENKKEPEWLQYSLLAVPDEVRSRLDFVKKVLEAGIHVQKSSSMGRLFDAVSALLGIRFSNSYEGECAIALENAAWMAKRRTAGKQEIRPLPFPVQEEDGMLTADRKTLLKALLREYARLTQNGMHREQAAQALALAFHDAAADMTLAMCRKLREKTGISQTALSGGVFANVLLQERCRTLLEKDGFQVYVNEQVPGNDGGICLGQAWIAARSLK